ncbi:alpha/beta hydrolase [Massilia endophytica]|uniref:alpha/beta hydrolase n=1 Tax=Massilia endophytica TaxID=2899220 RepID=UPI001E5FA9E0|nr:alpha/beta hydrolase [Massilia endophytica]UGQ45412.1 alpha/beta hydrolase [Massilia endophytica]
MKHPGLEPRTARFLQALAGSKPLERLSPAAARFVLAAAQKGAALPDAQVSVHSIELAGKPLRLHVVRPPGAEGTLPAFIYLHGGGWMLGDFPTHERLVRELVVHSGAAAVFIEYSRSPEAKYGVALQEIHSAARWVQESGHEIGVDGNRLAIAGNSAGGNLAAAVALLAKEKGGLTLRAQVLLWPATDAGFDTASYGEFSEGYFLTRSMMHWFWDHYAPDVEQRREIHASPLQASLDQLEGLPPALIQTAEFDVLRDEAEAYGRKLSQAGVDVTTVRYQGMIHDFGLLNALSALPASRAALRQAAEMLKLHLTAEPVSTSGARE